MRSGVHRFTQALRDLPGSLILPTWAAGMLIVLIGFTGSLVLTVPAAEAAGLTTAQLSSWVWAITVGSGLATITLSLVYRQPVLTAWSTPGLALLVTSLAFYPLGEVVGAYLIVGLAIALLGVSGLFDRVVRVIPQPVAMAVLAGLLLKYGLALIAGVQSDPPLVLAIVATFLALRRLGFRVPIAGALLAGFVVAGATGQLQLGAVSLTPATPVVVWPEFTVRAAVGLALPLLILALASQNLPGFAVMRAAGYTPPVRGALVVTGLLSALMAPMLNHGLTMAAITAAIGNSPEAHPDPQRRYAAAVVAGVLKIGLGLFGVAVVTLLTALPRPVVTALAGLALSGTIVQCLAGGFADPEVRDASLWALLVTAADVSFWGIGSAFWGFVVGVGVHLLLSHRRGLVRSPRGGVPVMPPAEG
ncbi:MAG: benzoate/H(+) symporter BenE family transporter [Chloroflexales bacterium]|nr:benzoate/H(+) symporter BenE family transporter [Chloroflexales bacterium]